MSRKSDEWKSLGSASQVESDDTDDDDSDTQELFPGESLPEEEGTDNDDTDTRKGGPQSVADADVEGEEGEAQEESGDRAADEGGDRPGDIAEALGLSGSDTDGNLEDDSNRQVEPVHSRVPSARSAVKNQKTDEGLDITRQTKGPHMSITERISDTEC